MKICALDLESVMPAHLNPWHAQTPEDDFAQGETEFKRERFDRARVFDDLFLPSLERHRRTATVTALRPHDEPAADTG